MRQIRRLQQRNINPDLHFQSHPRRALKIRSQNKPLARGAKHSGFQNKRLADLLLLSLPSISAVVAERKRKSQGRERRRQHLPLFSVPRAHIRKCLFAHSLDLTRSEVPTRTYPDGCDGFVLCLSISTEVCGHCILVRIYGRPIKTLFSKGN